MDKKRVMVTGLGVVAPNGLGKEAFWQALIQGLSGVRSIRRFDSTSLPSRIAGEIVDFDPLNYFESHELKKMDRGHWYAIAASLMAIQDAGLDLNQENRERVGSSLGNSVCGVESTQHETDILWDRGPRWGSPYFAISFFPCGANGVLSIRLGIKGPVLTFSNGNSSGTDAIGAGCRMIQSGRAEIMFCGGTEAPLVPLLMSSLSRDGWLSVRNDHPETACRPFDRSSDGMVLGEGSGILILEEYEHARARGAHLYAEVSGYFSANSAFHPLYPEPNGYGMVRTMKEALREANITPHAIDLVSAQGVSLLDFDRMESRCIRETFSEFEISPRVSAISSMTGNSLGAMGAFQAIASTLALDRQMFPSHANVSHPDSAYPIRLSGARAEPSVLNAVVQNSYCFMGKHSSIVYKKGEN